MSLLSDNHSWISFRSCSLALRAIDIITFYAISSPRKKEPSPLERSATQHRQERRVVSPNSSQPYQCSLRDSLGKDLSFDTVWIARLECRYVLQSKVIRNQTSVIVLTEGAIQLHHHALQRVHCQNSVQFCADNVIVYRLNSHLFLRSLRIHLILNNTKFPKSSRFCATLAISGIPLIPPIIFAVFILPRTLLQLSVQKWIILRLIWTCFLAGTRTLLRRNLFPRWTM